MEQDKKKWIKRRFLDCVGLLIVGAAIFALLSKMEQKNREEVYLTRQRFLRSQLKLIDTEKFPSLAHNPGPIEIALNPDGSYGEVSWTEAVKAEDSTNDEKLYVQKRWHCRVKRTWRGLKVTGPCEISRITGDEDERP